MKTIIRLVICFAVLIQSQVYGQSDSMVKIEGGEFVPLYGTKSEIPVGDFLMDVYPVTNAEFQKFVKENPQWKRSRVKKLFADENYLKN